MPGNLQEIPLSVIESWPAPNYVDPVRRTWMPAYAGVLQGLMTTMLGMRLFLRLRNQAGVLGLDDAVLVPAFMMASMLTTVIIIGTEHYGLDRHVWDLHQETLQYTALIGWLAEVAFISSTCCTKVSILLFYRRLTTSAVQRTWKYATLAALGLTICYGIAFILALIFNCTPTSAYWESYSPSFSETYSCADTTILNPLSGALSVLSDLYSVILPMGMLWRLEATKHQKWALNGVFSLGLVVVAAGAVRTYYLWKLGNTYDITWLGFDALVWSQAEAQLAVCCACAPSLRVFFRNYLSEPVSRAIHTVRSTGGHTAFRGSFQGDTIGIIDHQQRQAIFIEDQNQTVAKKGNTFVGDVEMLSPTLSEVPSEQLVYNPEKYESFVLEPLHEHRSASVCVAVHSKIAGRA